MSKKPYKPTTGGGRASICNWGLKVSFLTKEQCQKFIKKFMRLDIPVNFEYYTEEENPTKHVVAIEGFSWAFNLKKVAKMLESVDYELD